MDVLCRRPLIRKFKLFSKAATDTGKGAIYARRSAFRLQSTSFLNTFFVQVNVFWRLQLILLSQIGTILFLTILLTNTVLVIKTFIYGCIAPVGWFTFFGQIKLWLA